jgi:hypothetical protein
MGGLSNPVPFEPTILYGIVSIITIPKPRHNRPENTIDRLFPVDRLHATGRFNRQQITLSGNLTLCDYLSRIRFAIVVTRRDRTTHNVKPLAHDHFSTL